MRGFFLIEKSIVIIFKLAQWNELKKKKKAINENLLTLLIK